MGRTGVLLWSDSERSYARPHWESEPRLSATPQTLGQTITVKRAGIAVRFRPARVTTAPAAATSLAWEYGIHAMREVDLESARALIAACRWTFAKSVPEHPHEYCLRDWVSDKAEFDRFIALIAVEGYPGRFWGQRWVYLGVDGFKYWRSHT